MNNSAVSKLFLLLIGVSLQAFQCMANEGLRHLIQELGGRKPHVERQQQVAYIAKRLDYLVTIALQRADTIEAAKQCLCNLLVEDGPLKLGQDVNLWEIPPAGRILIIYNLPLNPSGASRKAVLRVWTPTPEQSTIHKSRLVLVEDTESEFGKISGYPIRELYLLTRDEKVYVLLFGARWHGRGRRALSMWNIDEGKCVWVKELAYGEKCKVLIRKEQVTLKLELEEFGREVIKRTEVYGWKNDGTCFCPLIKVGGQGQD